MTRMWLLIVACIGIAIPAVVMRVSGSHAAPELGAILFGVAILGGAFLLTWACEVAEMDIPQGVALAFLALVAVLPEYAVDLYFAWKAATHPEYTAFATANMTGANRLLIGIAWPLIILLNWFRTKSTQLVLENERSVELSFLTIATVYSFVIPFKGTISIFDSVVLVSIFIAYVWRILQAEAGEPELVGPALAIAQLRPAARRTVVVLFFVFAAGVILASAEPFAESLIHMGRNTGIDEFLLVQWLAPLASEAPELIIACILTLKGNAQAGMGAMVSSKMNQWTLLVGTLPLAYSASHGHMAALHLDARQTEEVLLTAAQSFLAIAVLCDLSLSMFEAGMLFLLFIVQLFFPDTHVRYLFALSYMVIGAALMMRKRNAFMRLFRTGFRGGH